MRNRGFCARSSSILLADPRLAKQIQAEFQYLFTN